MRLAHTLVFCTLAAGAAWAQAPAADPAAPTPPLRHDPLPASGAAPTAETGWRAANRAVAEFPRGHADILAWEARQRGDHAPPGAHHPHGEHR